MLPRVKIIYENGSFGGSDPSDDGVCGLIASGVAVGTTFVLGTAYLLTGLEGLAPLGITDAEADANANIYKTLKEFYTEAPVGSKVWLMGTANTVTMADWFDKTKTYAKNLIIAAKGAINFLITSKDDPSGYTATVVDGLDGDVATAKINAQALGNWAAETLYAPCFALIEGRHYSGTASSLDDLAEGELNRVGIVIGDTVSSSEGACMGLVGGRIADIPVQRSLMRVKTGAIQAANLYIGSKAAELGDPDLINDAGYICPRTFVGKAGYYWNNDKLATGADDDYQLIQRRRVIDKAYRIAYQTLVDELGDEIPVTDDGYIPAPICKAIQNKVETAIENKMTLYGNLGNDPGDPKDTGVNCFIDYKQNVVSTSLLKVKLRVKPYGYPKYIDVYLGFKTATA